MFNGEKNKDKMTNNANTMDRIQKKLQRFLFIFAIVFFSVCYGMYAASFKKFPHNVLVDAFDVVKMLAPDFIVASYLVTKTNKASPVQHWDADKTQAGLNKLVVVGKDMRLSVKITDFEGSIVHKWPISWFKIWPNATHIPYKDIPKFEPGTHIHGAKILANGDLIFNFEKLGLVRLNACGEIVWRLPYRTHHSIFIDDNGDFWVSGQIAHDKRLPQYPLISPPFIEPTILKVSQDGKILLEKSVFELLTENNQHGLLYLTSVNNFSPFVKGDLLHLNDVEVFSREMTSGFFSQGDVMISLRNANTIMVFNQNNWALKHSFSNEFVRQHDPDFVDGNTISVFDNNNVSFANSENTLSHSRIIMKSMTDESARVIFRGTKENLFFSSILGKHQWLANGNLLFIDATHGRAVEIDKEGEVVWDYINLIEPGSIGVMQGAERLPVNYDKTFFENAVKQCTVNSAAS